jgi:hypothetical protein
MTGAHHNGAQAAGDGRAARLRQVGLPAQHKDLQHPDSDAEDENNRCDLQCRTSHPEKKFGFRHAQSSF